MPSIKGTDGNWRNERGQVHREDGPAWINKEGHQEWYLNGKFIPEDEVDDWIGDMNINSDWSQWTDKEKMWFKLRFCGDQS